MGLIEMIHDSFHPRLWIHANETAAKYFWILKLRWTALAIQLVSIVPGFMLGFLPANRLFCFFAIIVSMGIVNALSTLKDRRENPKPYHLLIQLSIDLAGLAALLFITGGLRNPFVTLLLFHAALGPLLLDGKWNLIYLFLLLGSILLLLAAPSLAELPPVTTHTSVQLLSLMVAAVMIWKLTSWLRETLFSFRQNVRQLEQHENQMNRLRAVGALASGFSHELATPLNTIKLRLSRLERGLNQSSQTNINEEIRAAQEAVSQCEFSLRDLVKAQVDEQSLGLKATSLTVFVKRICESWLSEHPNAKLFFSCTAETPCLCRVPQLALSQTLLDILDNAWEAAPENGLIEVELSEQKKWIVLRIRDHGPGVPKIILEKIGEPFVTTKQSGTGLGLFNAVNLLEAIGGKFQLENRADSGADAKLFFPSEGAST